MDRFESLRLFTRIVELGSFTKAAGALDMPRATATYVIKELEDRLGVRLLERTTRQVRPTLDGQAFYERCAAILDDLEEAEAALRPVAANPQGVLRLDLHGVHANRIILPRIAEFRARYPRIALRISPAYLAQFGTPRHPDELARHEAVGFFARDRDIQYPFRFLVGGEVVEYKLPGRIAVSDAEAYTTCALQGCGLIQVPRFRVEEHLRAGQLVEVLADWPAPRLPISVLYPQQRHLAPRVRVFVDWVAGIYAERFGPV